MVAKEIYEYIKSQVNILNSLISFKDEYQSLPIDIDVIKLLVDFLTRFGDDLTTGDMPEIFITKMRHNIESLNIQGLFPFYKNFTDEYRRNSSFVVSRIDSAIRQLNRVKEIISGYDFYKSLGYVTRNSVVVGANGCGKTSLANSLTAAMDYRDGIVIPAQKLLIIPTFASVPNYDAASSEYNTYQKTVLDDKRTYNANNTGDIPYDLTQQYGAEYKKVLATLLSERLLVRNRYCDKVQNKENPDESILHSKLDNVLSIWNFLIQHRTIMCDENNNIILSDKAGGITYAAHQMSDGERVILYLIGRVLLAPENAIIVVDEPEMYLHKTIVDKLWNKLEASRNDCTFIYLTHDLTFAASRNANKYWIREFYHPSTWNIEPLNDSEIPEELLLKLLGSQKKILFCEGKKGSKDCQILEMLFPDYTITPVVSCIDVVNYTKAFNKIPNTNATAYGIIDRDYRTPEQLDKFERENVYSYDVAEIENLFLMEKFVTAFASYKREPCNIEAIKNKVISKLSSEKQIQVANYVSGQINHIFSEMRLSRGNSIDEVNQKFTEFIDQIDIDKLYNERETYIDDLISRKDYSQVINVYNNKGLCTIIEQELKIKSYYEKVLRYLQDKDGVEGLEILRQAFPSALVGQ